MKTTYIECRNHFSKIWNAYDGDKTAKQLLRLKATQEQLFAPVREALKDVPFPELTPVLSVSIDEREVKVVFVDSYGTPSMDAQSRYNHKFIREWAWDNNRTAVTQ